MANPLLDKTFTSALAIDPYTIVKFDGSDTAVAAAAGATDALIGVTTDVASSAGGECDVTQAGIAYVKLGGSVTRGDALTSDASGHAVAAGEDDLRVIGLALQSGVSGDVINMLVLPGLRTAISAAVAAIGKSGGTIGFYGVTPTARQVLATGASHTVDDVITALQTLGLVKQS